MAREAFRDDFAGEWIDKGKTATEERFSLLGMVGKRLLFVAYTLRGERIRIVSA